MKAFTTVLSVAEIHAARAFYEDLFGLELYQDSVSYTHLDVYKRQVLHNILGRTLGHAHHVLRGPAHLGALLHKLAGRRLALGTFLGGLIALMHITTNTADILAHNCIPCLLYTSPHRKSPLSSQQSKPSHHSAVLPGSVWKNGLGFHCRM